jgi:hypothetical protein
VGKRKRQREDDLDKSLMGCFIHKLGGTGFRPFFKSHFILKEFELQKKLGITPEKTEELVQRFNALSRAEKSSINKMVEITFNSCGIEGNTLSKKQTFVLCLYHHFSELKEY